MKRILLICVTIIAFQTNGFSQLTGTKTIKKTGGTYSTFTAAITDLNTNGVGSGGVTFLVDSNFIDSAANLTITTTSSSAANPIVFKKKGTGNNPVIIAAAGSGTTDGIIKIAGTDYITFERINLLESSLNTTTTTQMEWGYAILKGGVSNGAKFVTIRNCVITLNKANTASVGIYIHNHLTTSTSTLTVADTNGLNSYCKIYGDTISSAYLGIYVYGYAASSPYTLYDQYNRIGADGANSITNFGGGSVAVYGIYAAYQNNLKIGNNVINGGTSSSLTMYGIYLGTGTSAKADIYNNNITLASSATTSAMGGIYNTLGSTANSNTINIYNNIVQNCNYSTSTSAAFYGIYNSASALNVNIYGNTVTGNTLAGSGTFYGVYSSACTNLNIYSNSINNNQKSGTSGAMYCTYASTAIVYFYKNIIYSNKIAGGSSGLYGYYNLGSPTYESLNSNKIYDLTHSGTGVLYGIYTYTTSSAVKLIYADTIYSLTGAGGTVYGITTTTGTDIKLYKNQIYNLSSTGTSSLVYGIYVTSGTNVYLYNNFVSDLKASNATGANAVVGLYFSSATNIFAYYNTVFLNATTSATTFGNSAIYASSTPVLDLRNNIFVNTSAHGSSSGNTVAYYRSSTTLTSYSSLSNNNCFYAGTPGTYNLIYYDGTNSDQTISAYKTRVSPRDFYTFSENPPFVNVSSAPYDLHLSGSTATACESGGTTISAPITITDDIDGNTRNANFPDIGADEGTFTIYDLLPPMIVYTPLPNTSSTSARTLIATILDPSGIATSGTGRPVLYWRKNYNGSYTGATATSLGSNQFSFSYGSGVSLSDTIFYYVVANDIASTPNIGANPSTGASGFSANPPACSTPPTSPNFYKIIPSLAGGNYNIGGTGTTPGTGCTYVDLTAAFADIANKEITGAVNLVLTTYYKSSEEDAFPIVINPVFGANSTNKVTIKPATGINDTITGSSTSSIIKLNGADNIIIDGSNNGTTSRNLTIINTSTSTTTAAIWIASVSSTNGATYNTIKNCNISAGINSSNATYGICITGTTLTAAGTNNDNNTIQNNAISKAYIGILATGTNTDMDSLNIIDNSIGATTGNTSSYIWFKGIEVSNTTNSNISQNTIYNIITSVGTPVGLSVLSNVVNTSITKNNINNISYTGTAGFGGRGMYINTAVTSSNLTIANNVIYVISGDGYSSFSGSSPVGLYLDGAMGGLNIYYNSIYMSGNLVYNTTTITTAILFFTSTITAINLRNNAFVNSLNNSISSSAKNYAIYSNTAALNFTSINYNDYYVSGAQGILGYLGGDITTLSSWKTATSGDANSINADPSFNSTTNLQPNPGSPLLAAGTYISTVLTDYVGTTRSTSTPTIGAYEQFSDFSGPTISFTPFGNVSSTSARTLTATITDASGVPTSGSGLPRLYWKKNYNGSYTGVTASSIGSNQYNFTFGAGVSANDTIFYYLAAQDIYSTPNVSCSPATGASGFTTNPPAASTPPSSPAYYKIIAQLAGGSYNVGGTGTTPGSGCTYVDLTAAFNDINNKEIQGAITLVLTSYYASTEEDAFPIIINPVAGSSISKTVTIKPATGINVSITGSSTSSMIKLNGADFVTIDGSNNGSSSRNLTITNSSTSASTAVIWLSSVSTVNGATYNKIKNCNISAGINNTNATYGICITGTTIAAAGSNNDNNTIQNNDISKAYIGILATGTSGDMDTLNIIGNSIGATTGNTTSYIWFKGIEVSNTTNSNISQNTIYNIITTVNTPVGLSLLANVVNTSITKNTINNITYTGTAGYGGRGIFINTGVATSNLTITNNVIAVIGGDGYSSFSGSSPVGLYIDGTTGALNIYYNSIYMSGSLVFSTATITTAILFNTSTITNINLRNNVFVNTLNNTVSSTAKNYAIYSSTASNNFSTINYNDYFVSGSQGILGYLGTDITTLAGWKTATTSDANSINSDPLFNSTTNLQPNAGSPLLTAGTYISTVLTDFLGTTRSTTAPTIGAYEAYGDFSGPTINFTPLSHVSSTSARTLTATITDASGVPTSGSGLPKLYWKKNFSGSYGNVTASSIGSNQFNFTFGSGVSANDTVYYYIVAQDNYSSPNVSCSPSTGASGFTINPPAATTPPISPAYYKIIPQLAAGSYNIGGTGTTPASGCTYVDLTAAFNDINVKEIQGAINLVLTSYYKSTEEDAFPIIINPVAGSSASNTVTIKPASGTNDTITGSSTSAIIKINGADNIIIDGSNNNTTSRNLVIENTSTTSSTCAIWISSLGTAAGCENIAIKNSFIKAGSKTVTTTYGISVGSSIGSSGNDNDKLTIQNNVIMRAYYGVYAVASVTGLNNAMNIVGNILGDTNSTNTLGKYGLYIQYARNNKINQNIIKNLVGTISNPTGMYIGAGVDSTSISRNSISSLKYTGTSGYGGKGIDILTGYTNSNLSITNNLIYDISGDGWSSFTSDAIIGIRMTGTTGGIMLNYNTINLFGNITRSGATSDKSAALYIASTITGLDIRNNSFTNSIYNTTGVSKAYTIYSDATNTAFTTINYNNYYVSGSQAMLGFLSVDLSTLTALQTATAQDANSLAGNPAFVSTTDLHATTGYLNNTGTYLSAFTQDYTGTTRSSTTPDIGAYEYSLSPTVTTGTKSSVTSTSALIKGIVNANNEGTSNIKFEYGPTTGYGSTQAGTPATATGLNNISDSTTLSGLNPNSIYHYRIYATNSIDTAYGADSTFTTLAILPVAQTDSANSITSSSAVLFGHVNAKNASSTVTFEYGTTTAYGSSITATQSPVTGLTATLVSASIAGLNPNQTYHYRVNATNLAGTHNGNDLTFTTQAIKPLATTNPASSISSTTATLNGNVNANNSTTIVVFQWGTTVSYGNTDTATQSPLSGMSNTAVSKTLVGLIPNTTYHFRVVATNVAGTTNGKDTFFTTTAVVPVVNTDSSNNITYNSASLYGNVNAGNSLTTVKFEYGTTASYGDSMIASPSSVNGISNTLILANISGLLPNTLYHFRASGLNSAGRTNGNDLTFKTKVTKPAATTDAATLVTASSATLNGTVNANNDQTTVTFEYGFTTAYGNSVTALQSPVNGLNNSIVSFNLTSLLPNTMYHYRVVAVNSAGTVMGKDTSFISLTLAPNAITDTASAITPYAATMNGTVNAQNASTTVSFEYGKTVAYGNTVPANQSPVNGLTNTTVDYNLSSLDPNTTYHYRVIASSIGGTTYGKDTSFTTIAIVPKAVTYGATAVTSTGAILHGLVNANNSQTDIYFEYGTSTLYGTAIPADQSPVNGLVDTNMTKTLSGLVPNTTYHFRIYAINQVDTSFGTDSTFNTSLILPIAITDSASSIGINNALLNGTVNANNASTTVTFEYGLTIAYGKTVTATQSPVAGIINTAVSFPLSGLKHSTFYHYRVVAINSAGTSNGNDTTFTTADSLPLLTTDALSSVTQNAAVGGGNISDDGGLTIIKRGVCWSTSPNPDTSVSTKTIDGTGTGAFISNIAGLTYNTLYYVRAYAVNALGISYGNQQSFTTLPSGIEEYGKNQLVKIYASGKNAFVKFIASEQVIGQIHIFNLLGKEIYISQASGKLNKIDLSDFAQGYYIVKVIANGSIYSGKVFIE